MVSPTFLTEEEAQKVWCPKATVKTYSVEKPASVNRDESGNPLTECHCLATGCACWVHMLDLRKRTVGYCGLIHLPERGRFTEEEAGC